MNQTINRIALPLVLAVLSQSALAQQPTRSHQIPFELVGVDTSKEKSLSLQEAVELALRNNRDVEVERINVELSEFGVKSAEGRYDPLFTFGPSFTSRTLPVA